MIMAQLSRLAAVLLYLGLAFGAYAQVTTATIQGMVLDSSGAVVPGAQVTVAHQQSVRRETVVTDARGEFTVTYLPTGSYSVTISMQGFKNYSESDITVVAGQELRRDFTLAVGSAAETVTISGQAPLVNAVSAQQDVNMTEQKVRELPLVRRDISNLLNLAAGVSSGTDVGVSMNGLPPRGFLFTIDGVNAAGDPELRSLGMYQDFNYIKGVTIEAVEQVQIAKNIFSAEIANTVGGNVNLITKSGTNQYHGSSFWNYQAGGLNARNQFSSVRPSLVFHQFGGSVGGPIVHDRMFFFAAFEGYRLTSQGTVTGNVPSPELRALAIQSIPASKALFALYPQPTVTPAPGVDIGFYQGVGASTADDNHAVARWDWHLTPLNLLNVRYTRGRPNRLTPRVVLANSQIQAGTSENVSGTFTHITAHWSTESRIGFNKDDLTRTDGLYDLGISSISGPGFSDGGAGIFLKSGSTSTIDQSIAITKGRHSLKLGLNYQMLFVRRTDTSVPAFGYTTRADLLANSPVSATYRVGTKPWQMTSWQLGGFVQDDIKISRRLIVNLGLRYDYYSVPRERDGRIFNRDGPFGPYRNPDSPWNADYKSVSPRVGLALRLDNSGKTVLRSGYGIFFSRQNLFSGPVEIIKDAVDIPFTISFSRAELQRFRLNYGDPNSKAVSQFQGGGLISDNAIDPNWRNPYSQQWTLGIQRELAPNLLLDVAYVGSHALRLPYDPETNRVDRVTGLRPVAGFGAFNYYQSNDSSNYNALQTSLQKRLSADLAFDVAYTWASNMAYFRGDMHCCGGGEQAQDPNDLRSNRGPTTFFVRHVFRSNWIYELPFQRLTGSSNRAAKLALGGWQLGGIYTAQSGMSLPITQSSAAAGSRPDYIGGDAILDSGLQYLNRAAFALVPVNSVSKATIRPGTLGHRAVFGPGWWNTDLALSKRLRFTERWNLQLRADMFNAFNHTNFDSVVTGLTSAAFGQFTSTKGARVVQLNARVQF
jgi:hypothetical protein